MKDPEKYPNWIDEIITNAQQRGEFDDLDGTGKPIPGAGKKDDDLWWVRSWMERNRDPDRSDD